MASSLIALGVFRMGIPSTHASILVALQDGGPTERAWLAFHDRYRAAILAWGIRFGLTPTCAEDATQDMLLKLIQKLPKFHYDPARGPFRGWLKTVVQRTLIDFQRRQQRRPEQAGVGGSVFLERLAALADAAASEQISELIETPARVLADATVRVRGRVNEATWQAFYLTLVEHQPAADVAATLGLSVWNVYKAANRVKKKLAEELGHGDADAYGNLGAGDTGAVPGRGDPPQDTG